MRWLKRILLAAVAVFLLSRDNPLAVLIGLVSFLQAIDRLRPRPAFWLATATGTAVVGLAIPWLFNIFPGAVPFALFVLFGLFFGLFAGVAAWLAPRISSPWLRAFWIAAWWLAVEYFRCEWFALRFPWITPGISLGPTWLTPIIGVYGQSFLVVLAAALCAIGPAAPEQKRFRIAVNQIAGVALTWAVVLSAFCSPVPVAPREPVRVAAVQFEEGDFDEQFALTRAATNSPQLVVWPETAILGDPRKELRKQLWKLVEHAQASNVVFIIGCYTIFGEGQRDWFNTALTFDGSGMLGEHHKNRPVHLFNDGRRGTNATAGKTPLGKVGTPICFDCDYSEVTRRMARNGAKVFAVPSRDPAPWGDLQRVQHSMLFRLRAAECGRWFVVASAAGITQIIDSHGNVRAALPPYKPGILCGEIGREKTQTLYICCGWLLPWLLSAFAIIAGIRFAISPRPRA